MVTSCIEMSSHDRKIIMFNVSEGNEAFYSLFNDDEVEEMEGWLNREFGYDYSYTTSKEARECVIIDYCREWLCDNVRNWRYAGTEELFNILFKMN